MFPPPQAWAPADGNPGATGQKLLQFPTSGEGPGVVSRPEVHGCKVRTGPIQTRFPTFTVNFEEHPRLG